MLPRGKLVSVYAVVSNPGEIFGISKLEFMGYRAAVFA